MPQGGSGDAAQVRFCDILVTVETGQRARRPHQRQFAAQAIGAEIDAKLRRFFQHRVRHVDIVNRLTRGGDAAPQPPIFLFPFLRKSRRVPLESVAATDHLDAVGKNIRRLDLYRKTEAVEKLWPQFALLRVAGPHQNEARGMANAQSLALDNILPRRRGVEQKIDEVISRRFTSSM